MAEMRDACYFCGLVCVGVFSGFYPSGIAETHPAPGRSEFACLLSRTGNSGQVRTCLPSSCIFQGLLLTPRPQHTRRRECKDDCHCHVGPKAGLNVRLGSTPPLHPGNTTSTVKGIRRSGQKRFCACAAQPRPPRVALWGGGCAARDWQGLTR